MRVTGEGGGVVAVEGSGWGDGGGWGEEGGSRGGAVGRRLG